MEGTHTRNEELMTPTHYEKRIQPIEYIEANGLNFCEGNVVKYVTRYKQKGGVNDLKKAEYYIKRLIESYDKG